MRGSEGFTLIELMIVIGIIAILAGIGVHSAISASEEARATACEKNRVLFEEAEMQFYGREGRPSLYLQELVDEKYVNKVSCPRGGILVWETSDPELNYEHQSLVCSIHGPKTRIRFWESGSDGSSAPTPVGADFEDGSWGDWETMGAASIVGASFGSLYSGSFAGYVDTNGGWSKVVPTSQIAGFLGVPQSTLQSVGTKKFTGGSAVKIDVGNTTQDKLAFNFLTQEWTPTYWYNDTAFLSISNAKTGKSEVYKIADTYSKFKSSKTKFKEETGWLTLEDLGIDAKIEEGDTVGVGVLNASDKIVSSAILIDEGK